MAMAFAIGGWLAFAAVTAVAVLVRHGLAARSEAVARACHEVRGSLTAARLGLAWGSRASLGSRLGPLELELDRAVAALDDLQGLDRGLGRPGDLVDVEGWLTDSVAAFQPLAQALGVGLTVAWRGPAAQVWGRRARLAQASDNLIANAIEHGGSPIAVRGQVEAGRVVIEVSDQGPGIAGDVLGWLEGRGSRRLGRRGTPARGRLGRGRAPMRGRLGRRGRPTLGRLGRRGRPTLGSRGRRGRPTLGSRGQRATRGRGLAIVSDVAAEHGGRLGARPTGRGARLVLELPLAQ